MAITTIDGALAGMQPTRLFAKAATPTLTVGRPFSFWGLAGIPGAGVYDTTLPGVTLSSSGGMIAGQLPFFDPGSGSSYVARLAAYVAANGGKLLLCDRLWHNGGIVITSTGAQTIGSPTWPARDINGSTNGDGVLIGVEVQTITGAGTPTLTVGYTNSANVASHSAGASLFTGASSAAGSFYTINLQSGDAGVRSVQTFTLSASWSSGAINLVAYRVIASLDLNFGVGNAIDIVTGGMSQMYNGSVPFLLLIPNTTTATNLVGTLTVTQG